MANFQDGYLQQGQALGNLPLNVGLAADNTVINPGLTPFVRIVSNAAASSRTFTLAAGARMGQMLFLTVVGSSTNGAELVSTGNVSLTGGTWTGAVGDTLCLQWDSSSDLWRELTRTLPAQAGTTASGVVTPTFLAGTNVATATAGVAHYIRVGNQVFQSGTGSIACTAASDTASAFTVTLAIASNLAAAGDLTGVGNILSATGVPSASVTIAAETTANTATFSFNAAQTAAGSLGYSFSYTVI